LTPINVTEEQQRQQRISPLMVAGKTRFRHQYSDELNEWMKQCLSDTPSRRPTAQRLIHGMSLITEGMLKKMGGKMALVDLDVAFSSNV
jgi:hypothetical protein